MMEIPYLDRLRIVLSLRGSSMAGLAGELGMSENQLYSHLVDGRAPDEELDARISERIGLNPGDLSDANYSQLELLRTEVPSFSRLNLRVIAETLSTLSTLVPLALSVCFFLVFAGGITRTDVDTIAFLSLALGIGFLTFSLCYAGYRYSFKSVLVKGGASSVLRFDTLVFHSSKGSIELALSEGGYRVIESAEAFCIVPDGKPMQCFAKAGLTSFQIEWLRDYLKERLGAYTCTVKPTRQGGFLDEVKDAQSHTSFLSWCGLQSLGVSLSLLIVGIGLSAGLLNYLLGSEGWSFGGVTLIALGLLSILSWCLASSRTRWKTSAYGWISLGIGVATVVAGVILCAIIF